MGTIIKHEPVKLIIGLIGKEIFFDPAKEILAQKFGLIDFESQVLAFNFTDYYETEMGPQLKRKFFSFKQKIAPEALLRVKLFTNKTEQEFFRKEGRRQLNIDPGYLTLAKLVLATTKNQQHRLYLGQGIFAEVTLRYRDKTFSKWDWTYRDYCSQAYIEIFNHIRNNLLVEPETCKRKQ